MTESSSSSSSTETKVAARKGCGSNISCKTMKTPDSNDSFFWNAFAKLQDDDDSKEVLVWPTPKSSPNLISSTFGCRIRMSDKGYDFHRGVDIHGDIGDPVVASYRGTVKRVTVYEGGNKAVILEHTFEHPVQFHDNKTIQKWYTVYFHLHEQLVKEGHVVAAGDLIGTLGDSGVKRGGGPHLHHEVRLGSHCSLEWRLAHPNNKSSKCNKNRINDHIDPHVHPLYIYPRSLLADSAITLTLKQKVTSNTNGIVRIETPDNCPNVNQYEVKIQNRTTLDGGNTISIPINHVLDYNLRVGFDPTSTRALDTCDTTKPYLQPVVFGYKSTHWRMDLVIPSAWAAASVGLSSSSSSNKAHVADDSQEICVAVTNIWHDEPTTLTFGLGDGAW